MDDFCRLCLGRRLVEQDIFGDDGIYSQIKACLPIRVSETDRFPKKVCRTCARKVKDIYSYRQKTVDVQKQLCAGKRKRSSDSDDNEEDDDDDDDDEPFLKEEPHEQTNSKRNNGDIRTKLRKKSKKLFSKCTQTKLRYTDLEWMENTVENIDNEINAELSCVDISKNDELEKKEEIKVKIEEDIAAENCTINDSVFVDDVFDQNNSSDDDLVLSSITKKPAIVKDDGLEECLIKGRINLDDLFESKMEGDVFKVKRKLGRPKGSRNKKKDDKVAAVKKTRKRAKLSDDVEFEDFETATTTAIGEKKWQCSTCFGFAKSRSALFRHYKKHLLPKPPSEMNGDNTEVLPKPPEYPKEVAAAIAMKERQDNKRFGCDRCGEKFAYYRYLTLHYKYIHPDAEEIPGKQLLFRCPLCPSQFTRSHRVTAHVRKVHEAKKPAADSPKVAVLCDICGKGLSAKEHLIVHRRIHTGEKPYICKTCGKGFAKRCNMKLHEKLHIGDKPFVCSHCGKAFVKRSLLAIHERHHSEVLPYVCDICNKGYAYRGPLNLHLKACRRRMEREHKYRQLGIEPGKRQIYQCPSCPRHYTRRHRLGAHIRKVHKTQPPLIEKGDNCEIGKV